MLKRKNYPESFVFMFVLVTMRDTYRLQTTSETTITQNNPHLSSSIAGTYALLINIRTQHFTADNVLQ